MVIKSLVVIFILEVLLSTPKTINFTLGGSVCSDIERKALLTFKQDIKEDPYNHLSSWGVDNEEDCCGWNGVVCNNEKDDDPSVVVVVQLELSGFGLSGDLNPSLLELKHLTHLNLNSNNFQRKPAFLGSLENLIYLDLGNSGFVGVVPHQLGNLTNLIHLNVGGYVLSVDGYYGGRISVDGGDLEWLSNLSSLQYFYMSHVNLSKASSNWLHSLNMLPSLLELRLRFCELDSIPSLSYINFTSLELLDLSENQITSRLLPKWLFNLTSLKQLDLSYNHFQGTIPLAVGDLTSLTKLELSYNEFEGKVPTTLGNLCNLQSLDLFHNKFNGEISEFFRNSSGCIADSLKSLDLGYNQLNGSLPIILRLLTKLQVLKISGNKFQGIVTALHFANLTSMRELTISSMILRLRPDWIPPFQIQFLDLRNCPLESQFPEWLSTQKGIEYLDLSDTGISGIVPTWFWNLSSQWIYLNLSHNHLRGQLPDLLNSTLYGTISLRSNMFEGQIPRISPNVTELDLSNNSITGPITTLLCNMGNEMHLEILDLSKNLLSGELSECWSNWKQLKLIILESNAITGKIPISMGSLPELRSLHLRNNSLYGELPSSLGNCTNMVTIDVGENEFTGKIPKWIGRSLSELRFLILRLNKFSGSIPQELCHLSSLQLLDLAHNNLSGSIPRCFNNFSAMVSKQNFDILFYVVGGRVIKKETALLVTKGREFEYGNTLALFIGMDLSKNSLSGAIPEELTSLFALRSLNLSENYFTGNIPDKIDRINSLESIDFSNNKLSGLIPQSMAKMTFLNHLNLSYNNLSGKIPSSTQLQSFPDLSYMGNQGLCGPPLLKKCNGVDIGKPRDSENTEEEEDEDWVETIKWFYVSMSLGLVTGFWGFWGVLLVKKSWRFAYFRFVGDMIDKLY